MLSRSTHRLVLLPALAALMVLTGCETTGSRPSPTPVKTAATSPTDGHFPEPDDSWRYARLTTINSGVMDGNSAEGFVAIKDREFRLILKGSARIIRVAVSGNQARFYADGSDTPQWEGPMDGQTPLGVQPFLMLREVFIIALTAPPGTSRVNLSYRDMKSAQVEKASVYLGPRASYGGFPADLTVSYEKSKLQLSFLVKEE